MKACILTWTSSTGNWYDFLGRIIKKKLCEQGIETILVEFKTIDLDLVKKLDKVEVDLFISLGGVGSMIFTYSKLGKRNYWEERKSKFCVLHYDHPFYAISNHSLDYSGCTHFYPCRTYYNAANLFCKKKFGKIVFLPGPLLADEKKLKIREDNHFVILKNIYLDENKIEVKKRDKVFRSHVKKIDRLLSIEFEKNKYFDNHKFLLDYFLNENITTNIGYVNIINFYTWCIGHITWKKINFVVKELSNFPLKMYGNNVKKYFKEHKNLKIFGNRRASESQELFYSNYGIIDFSMTEGFHDRTQRALINETSFLTNNDPNYETFLKKFSNKFYNYSKDNLIEKCETIISNPIKHRNECAEIKFIYQKSYSWEKYLKTIISETTRKN